MTEDFDFSERAPAPLRRPTATAEPVAEQPHQVSPRTEERRYAQTARRRRTRSIGFGAVVALAAGLAAWFLLRDNGSSNKPTPANAVSVDQLTSLAASLGHPIFWLGPKSGYTYELTQTSSGRIYVRYLPPGVSVGASKQYLTVATYPFRNAFTALQGQSKASGANSVNVANGGIALLDKGYPESVHVAYPGVDYQVEVYDPTPGAAMHIVTAGQLSYLGILQTSSAQPAAPKATAASVADLKSVSASLGHPIYWVGAKPGYTYELTQTSNGNVYIRYLPRGVQVGASEPYLTVATYPFRHAFAALQQTAKGNGMTKIKLAGGGLAVTDARHPTSIHAAYPRSDVQVEVFDPSPAHVRQIVSSGKIAAIS